MRKLWSILIASLLAIGSITAPSSASTAEYESANFAAAVTPLSPESGEFDVVVYRSKSGQHAVLRIKFPQLGDKIQLMRVDSKGKSRQVFSYTLTEADLNPQGQYLNLQDGHFLRVFSMNSKKITYQVLVNGEEYLERKTLSKTRKPLVSVNTVQISNQKTAITGNGDFSVTVPFLHEGSSLKNLCFFVNGSAATSQLISTLRIGIVTAQLDQTGCVAPATGLDSTIPVVAVVNTKSLPDGTNSIRVTAGLTNSAGMPVAREASANFLTDNMSLNATAPTPMLSGQINAGQMITVLPGNWGNGTSFTYRWFSDGVLIRGATSDKYLVSHADVGKVLRVDVTGSKSELDKATRSVETTTAIGEQGVASASQGFIPQSFTTFNVTEQGQVYNSVTRRYESKEINNYNVNLSHPATVICDQPSSFRAGNCVLNVSASWGGIFDSFEWFSETVRLVRLSDRTQISTDSIYLSTSGDSDTLRFSFSANSLSNNASLNQFQLVINDAGRGQVLTPQGAGSISIIKGPNTGSTQLTYQITDKAVMQSQRTVVTGGGTAQNPHWTFWQIASPTKVKVMQACAVLPIYIAPQSLTDGSINDFSTQRASDATISIFGGNGALRERVYINGSRGDWTTLLTGNRLDVKVCGLNFQKGKKENLMLQIDLRYDSFNLESSSSTSASIEMVGNMKFTKINCFKDEEGLTLNAYKPVCPEGWTKTKAKVQNGKVEMKTLNCLAGRDLQIIRAPEPKCPEGYEVTTLRVRDGKLAPWSIVCRKGFDKRTIRAVFPSCPAGFQRSY